MTAFTDKTPPILKPNLALEPLFDEVNNSDT